jgi:general secretion pathway protein D
LIAEVTLTDDRQFGIEFGLQDGLLFDRSLLGELVTTNTTTTFGNPPTTTQTQTIQAASNTPGFDFNGQVIGNSGSEKSLATAAQVGGQGLSNFALGRTSELGFGGLVLSASSKTINALLRALQQNQRLEILSRPQVMTIDNQPAFIQVGQKVPRITNVTINQIGQNNVVALENVGLILGVTPRISPDGMVVMEIDAEKSEVAPEVEGIPISISATGAVVRSPRYNITTAQTTVSTASGETIVLGGLITKNEQRLDRSVPYLSDVPFLGWAFRYDSYRSRRTELLIILTPHVVRSSADAERLKQIEAARMHWCAADVHAIHGDPEFCRRGECPTCNEQMPVVYPDLDPRGLQNLPVPGGAAPVDADGNSLPDPGVSAGNRVATPRVASTKGAQPATGPIGGKATSAPGAAQPPRAGAATAPVGQNSPPAYSGVQTSYRAQ